MPPDDPGLRPALERAKPGDAIDGPFRTAHLDGREVLFGDGLWRWVDIRAWAQDRYGRETFLGEWNLPGAYGGLRQDWFVADPEKLREG